MQTFASTFLAALLIALTAACHQAERTGTGAPVAGTSAAATPSGSPPAPVAARSGGQPPFDAIRADETIRLVGTEPFWGGTIVGGRLTYSTPENQAGEVTALRRFAGNNGLGFSGALTEGTVDITITPGACSDGMSDRMFPFTATLKLGDEQRTGCAWTDRQPFSGPEAP